MTAAAIPGVEHELEEIWHDAPGIPGFLSTVDHKRIGMRYLYTSLIFFLIGGAIALVVTTLKLRAPGMTLNRLPIFVWSMLVFSFMVLFAVPAVTLAAGLLEADRLFDTAFFVTHLGGSALLYQHLFWFWGHP